MANVADDCPAAIVTVSGTVASLVSLLASETVNAPVVSVFRITVAVVAPAPPPSEMDDAAIVTVNAAVSSSVTSTVSVPSA